MKFNVGDRVNVYGRVEVSGGLYFHNPERGTVVHVVSGTELDVALDATGAQHAAHPKQCRKLKKKEKRRIWLSPEAFYSCSSVMDVFCNISRVPNKTFVEFVEVKKK